VREMLEEMPSFSADGQLSSLLLLNLSNGASAVWVEMHDAIEAQLRSGGDYQDVRDVASKAADNAARIAALFHMFEHGAQGDVGTEHMRRAREVVEWHLTESRRLFGEMALPVDQVRARKLSDWIVERCVSAGTSRVLRRDAQRHGPVREKNELDAAISELVGLGRVRLEKKGHVLVNPALLS
jgi:putative DNA primase/helicase